MKEKNQFEDKKARFTKQEEVERAEAILGRVSRLKRLDKSVGIGNLAMEAGVSLAAFEEALLHTGHHRDGQHVYFGLKSVKAAVQAHEREELEAQIAEQTAMLEALMKQVGRSLQDVAKPRQVKALKNSGKLSFRITQDEASALQHSLSLTGKPNVSAQVKACVEAYPRLHEIESGYQAVRKELEELTKKVDALPSLILKLAAK